MYNYICIYIYGYGCIHIYTYIHVGIHIVFTVSISFWFTSFNGSWCFMLIFIGDLVIYYNLTQVHTINNRWRYKFNPGVSVSKSCTLNH